MPITPRSFTLVTAAWRVMLALAVLLGVSACGGSPAPTAATPTAAMTVTARPTRTPQPTAPPTATSQSVADGSLAGTRVHFWHPWVGKTAEAVRVLVDLFNQSNDWGILVEVDETGGSGELFSRVRTVAQAGSPPDLAVATGDQILSWRQAGIAIADLTPYVEDHAVGLSAEAVVDYRLPFWQQDQQGETRLGFPALAWEHFLFYNQTRAEGLGFKQPPTSPEQIAQQACRAAAANREDDVVENDGTGGYLLDPAPETLLGWMSAFGGGAGGGEDYQFEGQSNEDALVFLKDLLEKNCAWIGKNPEPYTYFAIRYALMYSGSLADLEAQQAAMERSSSHDRWLAIAYPGVDGAAAAPAVLESYAVLAPEENTRLASWLFIRWISAPERQDRLVMAAKSLPLTGESQRRLSAWAQSQPQWQQAVELAPRIVMPPAQASWRQARGMIQDAAQQLFQPETGREQIPAMLAQMDAFAAELEQRQP